MIEHHQYIACQPLCEATTQAELLTNLQDFEHRSLPGFVIRRAGLLDVPEANHHGAVAELVLQGLIQTRGKYLPRGVLRLAPRQHGIGQLHNDAQPHTVRTVAVHTTDEEGEGVVSLANSGSRVRQSFYGRPTGRLDIDLMRDLFELIDQFEHDYTNPALMDTTVHRTILRGGDTVVFPFANQNGPVWHRFDTLSAERRAHITMLDAVA